MSRRITLTVASAVVALISSTRAASARPLIWDQSAIAGSPIFSITENVVANDFVVAAATRVRSVDVTVTDGVPNDDGALSTFNGRIGWAIYENGVSGPGVLVENGVSTTVVQQDTHLQSGSADIVRLHFALDQLVSLAPGIYWLALREGAWGEPVDGSLVHWVAASTKRGNNTWFSAGVTLPAAWTEDTKETNDYAFVVYGDAVVWDQSAVSEGAPSFNITGFAIASDFTLGGTARFSSLEIWVDDQDEAGPLENFSGEVGWAIRDDAAGVPGDDLFSGTGIGVRVEDTGLAGVGDEEIGHVELSFGRTIALAAGTYWLCLREGSWGDGGDDSLVAWVVGDDTVGAATHYSSNLSLDPSGPWNVNNPIDTAFVLGDQLIFGSGFEDGTICSWDGFTTPCD